MPPPRPRKNRRGEFPGGREAQPHRRAGNDNGESLKAAQSEIKKEFPGAKTIAITADAANEPAFRNYGQTIAIGGGESNTMRTTHGRPAICAVGRAACT